MALRSGPVDAGVVEVSYCVLSLLAKAFLGIVLLVNLSGRDDVEAALATYGEEGGDPFAASIALSSLGLLLPKKV